MSKEKEEILKMSPMMKAVKSAHAKVENDGTMDQDEIEKREEKKEAASHMATPTAFVHYEKFSVGFIECEWATLKRDENKKQEEDVILYCHGGGFISGGLDYARILAGKMTRHTGCPVVFFDYRVSPEYPYPAAIEDTLSVWDYLLEKGFDPGKIILAGDSAGGNLVLELCRWLKEEAETLPKALILMSPWTDMTMESASYEKYKDVDPILTAEYIEDARKAYLEDRTDYKNPDYSPLFSDFKDFPPTLIQVGSHEILRYDSTRLSKRMKKADVKVTLSVYRKGWHVFQQMPLPKALKAMNEMKHFLDDLSKD